MNFVAKFSIVKLFLLREDLKDLQLPSNSSFRWSRPLFIKKLIEIIKNNYLFENSPRSASLNPNSEKFLRAVFMESMTAIDPCRLNSTTSSPVALLGPKKNNYQKRYNKTIPTKLQARPESINCVLYLTETRCIILGFFDKSLLHNIFET